MNGIDNIITITYLQAQSYKCTDGGIVYASGSGSQTLVINGISVYNITCSGNGGLFYMSGSDTSVELSITSSQSISTISAVNGGLFYIQGPSSSVNTASLDLTGLNITKLATASNQGGVIYVGSYITSLSLEMISTTISNSYASVNGSILYYNPSSASSLTITISNSVVNCFSSANSNNLTTLQTYYSVGMYQYGGLFYIGSNVQSGSTIIQTTSSYSYCYLLSSGGIFNIPSTVTLTDTTSTYTYCSGYEGGILYCDGCSATFNSISATYIYSQNGGLVYSTGSSTVTLATPLKLTNLYAYNSGGGFYISSGTTPGTPYLKISDCQQTISTAQASLTDGGFLYSNNSGFKFEISNCDFQYTYAKSKGSFIALNQASSISIASCEFSDGTLGTNTSSNFGLYIYSVASGLTATLSSVGFLCESDLQISLLTNQITIGSSYDTVQMFYFQDATLITVSSSNFLTCATANLGAAFYLNNSKLIDTSSIFGYLYAQKGAAIYAESSSSVSLTSTFFFQTYADIGGSIYASNSTITMTNPKFLSVGAIGTDNGLGGAIYLTGFISDLSISATDTSTYFFNEGEATNSGGFIYANNVNSIILDTVNMTYGKATNGEGMLIYIDTANILSITHSIFQCLESNSITSSNTNYKNGLKSYGSGIYAKSVTTFTSGSNMLSYCYYASKGGAIFLSKTTFSDTSTQFAQNGAIQGGTIYAYDSTVSLTSTSITSTFSSYGASIYLSSNHTLTLTSVTISSATALYNGGLVYSDSSCLKSSTVKVYGSSFGTVTATNDGGGFYLQCSDSSLSIEKDSSLVSTTFTSVTSSKGSGGVIYAAIKSISIQYATASSISSKTKGSFLYSGYNGATVTLTQNTIGCDSTLSAMGGAVYVYKGTLTTNTNTISNCKNADYGGGYSIEQGTLTDTTSIINNNYATYGGGIYCNYCTMSLTGTSLTENKAKTSGGTFYFYDLADNPTFSSVTISATSTDSKADSGGIFYFGGTRTMAFSISQFSLPSLCYGKDGAVIYVNNPSVQITIDTQTISCGRATSNGGLIYIEDANSLTIKSSTITLNSASSQGHIIYSKSSNVAITLTSNTFQQGLYAYSSSVTDSTYSYASGFYIKNAQSVTSSSNSYSNFCRAKNGGVFYIDSVGTFTDVGSEITSNSATLGGFMYCSGSAISLQQSHIYSNAAYQGGAFYIMGCGLAYTDSTKSVIWKEMYSYKEGGVFYIADQQTPTIFSVSLENLQLQYCYATSTSGYGGAFYIDSTYLTKLTLTSPIISGVTANGKGGVFYISNMDELTINSAKVSELSSISGRFLYADPTDTLKLQVYSSTFLCSEASDYDQETDIDDELEDTPSSTKGSMMVLNNVDSVTSSGNTYKYCYIAQAGSVYTLTGGTTMTETGSTYKYNAALNGGAIKCDTCTLTVSNSDFSYNFAQQGGIVLVDNQGDVQFSNCDMHYNNATTKGGVASITATTSASSTTFKVSSSDSIYKNYGKQGALAYISNEQTDFTITSSTLYNMEGSVSGGLITVISANTVTIKSSTVTDTFSPKGSIIFSTATSTDFTIYSNSIVCNSTYDYRDSIKLFSLDDPVYKTTSAFDISDSGTIYSTYNKISQCGFSKRGGVFNLQSGTIEDEYSKYTDNSAIQGGVIACTSCNLYTRGSTYSQNKAITGGVIVIDTNSFMSAVNIKVSYNKAYIEAGAIYVSTESYFNLEYSDFFYNNAPEQSVMSILGSSQIYNNSIRACLFENNTATKNTISIMNSHTNISDSAFVRNYASSRSKNLFIGFSTVVIKDCDFKYTKLSSAKSLANQDNTYGSFIFSIMDVNLYIMGSSFQYGIASYGGAIYISGSTYAEIMGSVFENNYSGNKGGAIYASGYSFIKINASSSFTNNYALSGGDDLTIINSENIVNISNTVFSNPTALTSVYSESSQIFILNSTFKDTSKSLTTYGGSFRCIDCRQITIKHSIFRNGNATYGGAISIEETSSNHLSTDSSDKYLIQNTLFESNKAIVGGALYLSNVQYLTIQGSNFTQNKAKNTSNEDIADIMGSGGGIYFDCDESQNDCKVTIKSQTVFKANQADIKGGAIHWTQVEPSFSTDLLYISNSAGQYGDDVSCFSRTLSVISKSKYLNHMAKIGFMSYRLLEDERNLIDTSTTIAQQQSGGDITDTYLAHLDKYGQIVGSDQESIVKAIVNTTYSNGNTNANTYPPVIEGTTQWTSVGGVVLVSGLSLTATPGYNFSISFSTNGIDTTKPSNKEYYESAEATESGFEMYVNLRKCIAGEQFTSNGKCSVCDTGSYSLVEMSKPGYCIECPSNKALCYGGTKIGPKPGYWRKNNSTSTFIECLYKDACLGMVPPENSPIGSCDKGYQGILCADCQLGYSRSSEYECQICPEKSVNGVRIFFIMLLAIILVVLMVRSTLAGAKDVSNVTSIYTKIIMNHLQLVMLTASFKFQWPEQVVQFFNTSKPVGQATSQVFSFDCFMDSRKSNEDSNEAGGVRVFFQKLILYAVLPFILTLVCLGFWHSFYAIKKLPRYDARDKAIASLIILLFLLHPSIVQAMFYNFKCINVDGESRLQNDLQVLCSSTQHNFFSYLIAIPSIIAWGFGIPFFSLGLLMRVRKFLEKDNIRVKYGFLYRGYRKEFFYWESVIMYRKIALIMISVFVSSWGVISQALIVFLLLIAFFFLNSKYKPFSTIALNDLELMSIVTSILTIYCGLFYASDVPASWVDEIPEMASTALVLDNSTKMFFFAVIVLSNAMFILYWLFKMYQEMRHKIRKAVPKYYAWVCLCGNYKKLEAEIKTHELSVENERLREGLLTTLESLKDLFRKGDIILNMKTLEKVGLHLTKEKILHVAGMKNIMDHEDKEKNQKRNKRINDIKEQIKVFNSGTEIVVDSSYNDLDEEDEDVKLEKFTYDKLDRSEINDGFGMNVQFSNKSHQTIKSKPTNINQEKDYANIEPHQALNVDEHLNKLPQIKMKSAFIPIDEEIIQEKDAMNKNGAKQHFERQNQAKIKSKKKKGKNKQNQQNFKIYPEEKISKYQLYGRMNSNRSDNDLNGAKRIMSNLNNIIEVDILTEEIDHALPIRQRSSQLRTLKRLKSLENYSSKLDQEENLVAPKNQDDILKQRSDILSKIMIKRKKTKKDKEKKDFSKEQTARIREKIEEIRAADDLVRRTTVERVISIDLNEDSQSADDEAVSIYGKALYQQKKSADYSNRVLLREADQALKERQLDMMLGLIPEEGENLETFPNFVSESKESKDSKENENKEESKEQNEESENEWDEGQHSNYSELKFFDKQSPQMQMGSLVENILLDDDLRAGQTHIQDKELRKIVLDDDLMNDLQNQKPKTDRLQGIRNIKAIQKQKWVTQKKF